MRNIRSAESFLNCERGFQKIAHACLENIQRNHPSARRGDVEGIHRMRVALTRLRAARKFFSAMVTDDGWRAVKQDIAWLNRILGDARDNDVALAYTEKMPTSSYNRGRRHGIAKQASDGHAAVARALKSNRYRHLLAELRTWINHGPWKTSPAPAIGKLREALLARYALHRLKQWSHRFVRWNARPIKVGRQHRICIMAKRYRYMVEALSELDVTSFRKCLRETKAARQLQRALGDLRDLRRIRHKIDAPREGLFTERTGKLLRRTRKALNCFS